MRIILCSVAAVKEGAESRISLLGTVEYDIMIEGAYS